MIKLIIHDQYYLFQPDLAFANSSDWTDLYDSLKQAFKKRYNNLLFDVTNWNNEHLAHQIDSLIQLKSFIATHKKSLVLCIADLNIKTLLDHHKILFAPSISECEDLIMMEELEREFDDIED